MELADTLQDLSRSQEGMGRSDTEVVGACLDGNGAGGLEGSCQELDVGFLVAGDLGEALSDPRRAVATEVNQLLS